MSGNATELWAGRYEPLEIVGGGGTHGTVWRGRDRQHDRIVALKVRLASSKAAREALLAETRALLSLRPHANLPLVRDDFFVGRRYVLVTEWIDGVNLAQVLADRGDPGLAPSVVLGWLDQLAAAIDHLHAVDPPVVHGDVKPTNAVLGRNGRVVLVGVGRSLHASDDASTPAGDIYGLAATATALLSGHPPGASAPEWSGIDPSVARVLERAIGQGLSREPSRRPASAAELVERMSAFGDARLDGIVTFVAIAVDDSTQLWDADAAATATALAELESSTARLVEAGGGRLLPAPVGTDTVIAAFPAATAAVAAAVGVQSAARSDGGLVADRVVIAIATGEAQRRGANAIAGPALNRAVALAALGHGGQVLLAASSSSVAEASLPAGASLTDVGRRALGGSRPERIRALVAPGLPDVRAPLRQPSAHSIGARSLVAVGAAVLALIVAAVVVAVVVGDDSDAARELTAGATIPAPPPSLRPIVFESDRSGHYDIYAMDSVGGGQRLLLLETNPDPTFVANSTPALSPDGTQVAFTSERQQNIDLYVAGVESGTVRRLTTYPGTDTQAAWSPDGKRIAFTSFRNNGRAEIFVLDVAVGEPSVRNVARADIYGAGTPSWSPDGTKIAYSDQDVLVVDAAGSNQVGRRLTHGLHDGARPQWSPDGTTIAFSSKDRTGFSEVYLVDAVRGMDAGLQQITDLRAFAFEPVWSPDGSFLVFASTHEAPPATQIYGLPVNARKARSAFRLTHVDGAHNQNANWR